LRHDVGVDEGDAVMRTRLAAVVAGVLLLGTAFMDASPVRAAVSYRVEDLGTLPGDYASVGMGINQLGDVVGWSAGPTGTRRQAGVDCPCDQQRRGHRRHRVHGRHRCRPRRSLAGRRGT
jgi:hypothetical protein